jgi:hypothetical protein
VKKGLPEGRGGGGGSRFALLLRPIRGFERFSSIYQCAPMEGNYPQGLAVQAGQAIAGLKIEGHGATPFN